MGRKILTLITLIVIAPCGIAIGQPIYDTVVHRKLCIIASDHGAPMVTTAAFFDLNQVENWYIVPDSAVTTVCRLLKVDNVFYYKLKAGARLLTYNECMDKYKISEKYRQLPLIVDDKIVDHPEDMLIAQNQIEDLKIFRTHGKLYLYMILNEYRKIVQEEHDNPTPPWN